MKTELLYVADPMCSWCFAFAPLLERVRADLREDIGFRLVLGGLAPDDDSPMAEDVSGTIKEAWRSIEKRTSTRFNWSYWENNQPRRSTWPACRAVLAAGDRGQDMFKAIQQAYYQDARDPSDLEVLADLGTELGFEREAFAASIQASATRDALEEQFNLRDQLRAGSLPSLGLLLNGELRMLSSGWVDETSLRGQLAARGLLAEG